jgi:hypothetical protein
MIVLEQRTPPLLASNDPSPGTLRRSWPLGSNHYADSAPIQCVGGKPTQGRKTRRRDTDYDGNVSGATDYLLDERKRFFRLELWRFTHNAEDDNSGDATMQTKADHLIDGLRVEASVRVKRSSCGSKDALRLFIPWQMTILLQSEHASLDGGDGSAVDAYNGTGHIGGAGAR